VGLCCTHYGLVADRLARAVSECTGRPTVALDPNRRLVEQFVAHLAPGDGGAAVVPVSVSVVSKVALTTGTRENVARAIEPMSPVTAEALRAYAHEPALF
jgi:glutamate racemase